MSACKGCKRPQRAEHLTGEGLCVFCAPVAMWPATKWMEFGRGTAVMLHGNERVIPLKEHGA